MSSSLLELLCVFCCAAQGFTNSFFRICSGFHRGNYVSRYGSAIGSKQEADRRFTWLVHELQVVSPSDRWREIETARGIDSIRSYTYEDQNSDAHIDLDLIVQLKTGGEYFYLVTIFGWAAKGARL